MKASMVPLLHTVELNIAPCGNSSRRKVCMKKSEG